MNRTPICSLVYLWIVFIASSLWNRPQQTFGWGLLQSKLTLNHGPGKLYNTTVICLHLILLDKYIIYRNVTGFFQMTDILGKTICRCHRAAWLGCMVLNLSHFKYSIPVFFFKMMKHNTVSLTNAMNFAGFRDVYYIVKVSSTLDKFHCNSQQQIRQTDDIHTLYILLLLFILKKCFSNWVAPTCYKIIKGYCCKN